MMWKQALFLSSDQRKVWGENRDRCSISPSIQPCGSQWNVSFLQNIWWFHDVFLKIPLSKDAVILVVTWPSTYTVNVPLIPSKAALSRKKRCLCWFEELRAESKSHCLSFPVLGFMINCDFCFVLFFFLAEEIKCNRLLYGGLYLMWQKQQSQEVQGMVPRMDLNKNPSPTCEIEAITRKQKMQGVVLFKEHKIQVSIISS